jgi:hypothetical protein
MEDLRRAVAPTRAERVGLIGRRVAALVRRDPSSLLRVFHLRNWPDRMRRVLRK